ncbi:MAG: hypothetical protein J6Q22_10670 [Prevotella sp.]|nr:hypothetical protein [Prevotella sp.]
MNIEDLGENYQQYCDNPKNEDKSAKPGEDAFFDVSEVDICDYWCGKDDSESTSIDIIHIDAEPRYPEDAYVNDEQEDNDNPKMPFLVKQEGTQDGWCWKLDIDIETGEIIGWPKEVNVRTHYKVCDCCGIKYKEIKYRDYVPEFLSIDGDGYGDYIMITIEDGKIKNWNEDDCREFIRIVRRGDN